MAGDPEGAGQQRRMVALDGLRGLMTILVIVSHYFAEVPHGVTAVRHCERSEAIQPSAWGTGLLRFARNDGVSYPD